MKVLIINATYSSGSTGKIVAGIQQALDNANIDSKVGYAYSHIPSKNIRGFKIGNFISNKIHALLSRIHGKSGYFSFLSTWNLIKKIDQYKPDIINLHNIHSNFVNINLLIKAIAKRRITLVLTLHDCWFFTGGCSHFTATDCYKWKKKCGDCPQRMLEIPAYLNDKSEQILKDREKLFSKIQNLHVVGVSKWITNLAKESCLKNATFHTIHNGINLDIFRPIVCKTNPTKKIILGVAYNWNESKGLTDFITLSQKLNMEKYKIKLIGLTPQQIFTMPKGIIGLEKTNNINELVEEYNNAFVFLNPTYNDTYPTTNLEAIACNTPVISYCTGGSPESITPETGKVVEAGNIDELIQSIESIDADTISAKNICREYAIKHFDEKKQFAEYITLFKEILNQSAHKSNESD